MEITRSGILRDCLEDYNRKMYRYSKHQAGLEPLPGYEKLFDDLKQSCDLLRGMIRNAEDREREARAAEGGQRDLAAWQMDIIKGNQPGVEWADKAPGQTVDDLLRRRRMKQAEEFKPAPVVYPGGKE